jgi:hypothetical protein
MITGARSRLDRQRRRLLEQAHPIGDRAPRQLAAPEQRLEAPVAREEKSPPLPAFISLDRQSIPRHSRELRLAIGQLLVVHGDAQRPGAADRLRCFGGDPLQLSKRQAPRTGGALASVRVGCVVMEGGDPREEEAAVPPGRAPADRCRVDPDHRRAEPAELADARQPAPAKADDAGVGIDRPRQRREA